MMRFPGRLALAFPLAASGQIFIKSEVVLTDSQLETPEASDDAAWLRKGLEYYDDTGLTDAERHYLDGDAPSVSEWSGGEDWEQWLTEAREKLPEPGVEVDDHKGTPIGEGESLGLVAAEMVMDKDQVSKLPEEFQSGLFQACPAAGCPKWPVGLRISHTNAGVDLTRFALKVGTEDGEIDLTFTETLKSFPIANKEQLKAFAFSVKFGKIAALLKYPKELGALTLNAVKDTAAAKDASEKYAAVSKDYYSLTPYLIGGPGAGQRPGAMKYRLVPTSAREPFPDKGEIEEQGFKKAMRDQAAKHMAAASHSFSFEIQVATQASKQPLNDANAEWDEKTAPWVKMGTVTIPKQDFTQPVSVANVVGSGLWHEGKAAFNSKEFLFAPGQSPHRPLGDINVFRADLYPSYDQARQKYLLQKSGACRRSARLRTLPPGCARLIGS